MSIEEQYELFEAYLDNSMTVEEKVSFEVLLNNPEIKQAFEEYSAIQNEYVHLIQQRNKEEAFLANLKTIGKSHPASSTENNTSGDTSLVEKNQANAPKRGHLIATKTLKWVMSAAAVLVLGFFGYQNFFKPKQNMQQLFASNYDPEKLSVERGSPDDSLVSIVDVYNKQNYQQALPALINYSNAHPEDSHIKLAIANCHLALQDYGSAEKSLKHIILQQDVFQEKAEWYLAMLYLKQNKKEETIQLLKQFGEHHFYYKKSRMILKNLE